MYETYRKSRDPLFEAPDYGPPPPFEGNAHAEINIVDDSPARQQETATLSSGTIIDWFERSLRIQIGTGIIRPQYGGDRLSFTEKDVVSGEPKVGHKVSFSACPSWSQEYLPTARNVTVDPPQLQPEVNPEPQELPEKLQRLIQRQSEPQPEPSEYSLPQPQAEDMVGKITAYNPGNNTGLIHSGGRDYMMYGHSIIRGFASVGASVRFRTSDRDREFATAISID